MDASVEPIAYEGEDADYYDLVVGQALETLPRYGPRYDAILVDEGQDFSDDMFRVIVGLLNPATDNLTIALDDAQDIYRRRRASWKELGVRVRGRVHRLLGVYRNTGEIARFADRFIMGATVRGVGGPAAPTAGYASGFRDVAPEDVGVVNKARFNGLIDGTTTTTFNPYGTATQGHAAKVRYRALVLG